MKPQLLARLAAGCVVRVLHVVGGICSYMPVVSAESTAHTASASKRIPQLHHKIRVDRSIHFTTMHTAQGSVRARVHVQRPTCKPMKKSAPSCSGAQQSCFISVHFILIYSLFLTLSSFLVTRSSGCTLLPRAGGLQGWTCLRVRTP